MPKRKRPSLLEKIRSSEDKIKALIEQRNNELIAIINECHALAIDNSLLAGFLLFAQSPDNKDHPILKEFRELAKPNKIPSKPKQRSQKSAKKAS